MALEEPSEEKASLEDEEWEVESPEAEEDWLEEESSLFMSVFTRFGYQLALVGVTRDILTSFRTLCPQKK